MLITHLLKPFIIVFSISIFDSQGSLADKPRQTRPPTGTTPRLLLRHPRSAVLPLRPTMTPLSQPRSALPLRKLLLVPISRSTPTEKQLTLSLLPLRSVLRERRRVSLMPLPTLRMVRQMERLRALSRSLLRRESVLLPKGKSPRSTPMPRPTMNLLKLPTSPFPPSRAMERSKG